MTPQLLGVYEQERIWDAVFGLTWIQHGGSGTGLSLNDVLELDFSHFNWWSERANKQRQRESRDIRNATRSRGKKG